MTMRGRARASRTALALLALVAACTPPGPSSNAGLNAGRQVELTASAAAVQSASVAVVEDEVAPVEPAIDPKTAVKKWLDDPRLAEAKTELALDHYLTAARAAHKARMAEKIGADAAAVSYLEGVLYLKGGAPDAAYDAFLACADHADAGSLAPYARLRATELAASLGKYETALKHAAKIDDKVVPRMAIDAATIESLARAGTAEDARPVAKRMFFDAPTTGGGARQPGWAIQALRVAKSLSLRPTVEHARLGIEITDRVRFEAPRGRGSSEADKLMDDLVGRLPRDEQKKYRDLSDDEQIDRGRRLADSDQAKRATTMLDKIAKRLKDKIVPPKTACALGIARGKALGGVKRKREAYDALEAAASVCEGEALSDALMNGGRAAARAKLGTEAASLFGRFEAAFPTSPLADDARLEAAKALLDSGDAARFRSLLGSIEKDYPAGDKLGDALFALALEAMERNAWAEARPALEKGSKLGAERVYTRAGRFDYFLGRALEQTGDSAGARAAYEKALTSAPLYFYASLAAARLEQLAPGRPQALFGELLGAKTRSVSGVPASMATDARVDGALRLAGLQDAKGVGHALAALGLKDHTAQPPYYLFGARLLAAAGDAQAAHALLRTARERDFGKDRFDCELLASELPRPGDAREAWELSFPKMFPAEVEIASKEAGVPPLFIQAIMREESAFLPRALSVADARGLLQVIPATGSRMARTLGMKYTDELMYEPGPNLRVGAAYLRGLRRRFAASLPLAVAGYNAGPGAPDSWIEDRPSWDLDLWVERIPYLETRNYVKRVWASYFAYEVLYGSGALQEIVAVPAKVPASKS